jgi:putative transposase
VVGTFSKGAAVMKLVDAVLKQSNEWATQRSRYTSLEAISVASATGHVKLSAAPA